MKAVKLKQLGAATVQYRPEFEPLLEHQELGKALDHVKSLRPVTVPLRVKLGERDVCFSLRRTRRNHFSYLIKAEEAGVSVEKAVANVEDPETKRFYLFTIVPQARSITSFLSSTASVEKKFNILKKLALELAKFNKADLRHGDVVSCNVSIGKGDEVILTNPELDDEVVQHLHSDFDQLRETLLGLERELQYEPAELWEKVRKENYFKNAKS